MSHNSLRDAIIWYMSFLCLPRPSLEPPLAPGLTLWPSPPGCQRCLYGSLLMQFVINLSRLLIMGCYSL
ncbi:hypothetical protein E2C01_010524 [Portunus trituberculatus]|uniref:Uncharacterized protein n=1 Tax=Portunus trituberculatus TaxID=210409 RepID=A0A5B7D8L3_PORTR|nr:hypothetical protein [Portunus trituberculatus]